MTAVRIANAIFWLAHSRAGQSVVCFHLSVAQVACYVAMIGCKSIHCCSTAFDNDPWKLKINWDVLDQATMKNAEHWGLFDIVAKPWCYNFWVCQMMLFGPKWLFPIHLHREKDLCSSVDTFFECPNRGEMTRFTVRIWFIGSDDRK